MSSRQKETITCPQCGKEDEFIIWGSINTVLDPDMKEKVRSGEAFRWTCPHCGNTANVNYTTLYHQMEDHVMIYLVFGDQEKAIEMMQGLYRDNEGNIIDADLKPTEDYRNRVVGTMNEFREKLMILDAGLDDRIIELMKLFILANLQEKNPELQIGEFLFDRRSDGETAFAVDTGEQDWGVVAFNQEFYEHIADAFKETLVADKSVVINQEWALELLHKQD